MYQITNRSRITSKIEEQGWVRKKEKGERRLEYANLHNKIK